MSLMLPRETGTFAGSLSQTNTADGGIVQNEADYSELFHHAPVGCCTIDEQGHFLTANRLIGDLLSESSATLIGQSITRFLAESEKASFLKQCERLEANRDHVIGEMHLRRSSGVLFWAFIAMKKFRIASGAEVIQIVLNDITQRKEQESSLLAEHERFQFALDATRDGIWDWNIATGDVYFSPQWARLLGFEADEVPSRVEFFYSVLHPDDISRVTKVLDEHLAGLTSVKEDEVRLRMKSGEYRWFFDRGSVVTWNEAGTPSRMVGTITDINARKLAEAALKESQNRTRLLVKAASVGLWDWNLLTNEVYFSPEWKQQLGCSDEEISNHFDEWKDRLHPADLPRTLTTVQDFRTGRRHSYEVEFRLRHKDGSWRWIFARADLARDHSGEAVRMMGCHFDITERKRAEDALLESEARLREAQTISQIGHFHWDALTHQVTWSDELFRLYGRTKGVFVPTFDSYIAAIHPEDRDRVLQALQSTIQLKTRFEHQYQVVLPDNTSRWVHARGLALQDSEGNLTGLEGTCQDITERKRAEDAHESLEAQLRESQKMEAIGTLAGGIAHDFNNILAAILGNVEIAIQEVADVSPGAAKCLEDIRHAGARARELVQQILSFSRRQPTNRKIISLIPVIEESCRLLRATLPSRIKLVIDCHENVPPVLADATQIEQVLLNLATNSMQALIGQTGSITIRLELVSLIPELVILHPSLRPLQSLNPNGVVRLSVSDDGPGMDASTRQRVFEPFFTTKPVGEGTGLGLSVVHGIVQGHGAEILVKSEPGQGATFSIYFPVTSSSESTDMQMIASVSPQHPLPATTSHVLYLDDDNAVLILVKRLLERRGYRVSCFSEPQEALAALRSNPADVDVLVTDFNMPGMHGLDVARAVRSIRPDLPVAVTSGFVDEELQAGVQEAGVRRLIAKPFAMEELYSAIQRLIES